MAFFAESKAVAAGMLRTWRYVPTHLMQLKKLTPQLLRILGRVGGVLGAILACLLAPMLFWLAPLLVPLQRKARADSARAHQEALDAWASRSSLRRKLPSHKEQDG